MVDKKDIKSNLLTIGLTQEESSLYLVLLEHGALGVLESSKLLNIPRTTTYRIVQSLQSKGFLKEIVSSRGKLYSAIMPSEMQFLVQEKESQLLEFKKSLAELQSVSSNMFASILKTQVKYYKGKDGLKQIIWNSLKAKDEIVGYSEFGRVDIVGKSFYSKYVKEFKEIYKLQDRVISNQRCIPYYQEYVQGKPSHQLDADSLRILSEEIFYVSGDHSLYNDIYSISYWKESEIVGVEIQNAELVKLHKSIFEILWNLSKPIEKI